MRFDKRFPHAAIVVAKHGMQVLAMLVLAFLLQPLAAFSEPEHAIAMHGEPLYPADFTHFDYVNPDAPIGGAITVALLGSFDSLNPFIVKGTAPIALRVNNYVFERLLTRSYDEPFSLYGLLAESVETPDDRSSVTFKLRETARFSDGAPVTVADIVFSLETLRDEGRPNYKASYEKVVRIEEHDAHAVTFHFADGSDREIPLIIGLMPILPKHIFGETGIADASLEKPVGSGPYLVDEVDPGTSLTFRRNPDYWGWGLAVNRGHYNFDKLRLEFYRDNNTMFEAFKKGLYQFHNEGDPTRWATGYTFPAIEDGRVVREEFETGLPKGMGGYVFNTRKPIFEDVRVRRALIQLLDFVWINSNLYFGLFERTQSYFFGSTLSSYGVAADDRELALLGNAASKIDPAVLDGSYQLPASDGSARNRKQVRAALKLFEEAGYGLDNGQMINLSNGTPFTFELLVASRDQERLALSYAKSLERAGISISIRLVDAAQYQQRLQTYDFDMIQNRWYLSLSPGNEQNFYWGSQAAKTDGTRNYMGISDPDVDRVIAAMIGAREREDLVAATRALDRLLMSGRYIIPLFHTPKQWIARWKTVERPEKPSLYGTFMETWWSADASQH